MSIFDKASAEILHVNAAPVAAIQSWNTTLADGRNYTPQVGNLALAPSSERDGSILQQPIKGDKIDYNTFGLHMGSAKLKQAGSLILGGYDRHRVLGSVGVFNMMNDEQTGGLLLPRIFLRDITIGVEAGLSPFDNSSTDIGSIFHGIQLKTKAQQLTISQGGPPGSPMVVPDPTASPIYLPIGACQAAAEYLPVTSNETLGYYLWNVTNPQYTCIVIFYRVLDLTLESPIVEDKLVQYFPCRLVDSTTTGGYWVLGRAFLQAAFLGVNYHNNLTFLAQGPGPNLVMRVSGTMEESKVVNLEAGDVNVNAGPLEFRGSWAPWWNLGVLNPLFPEMDLQSIVKEELYAGLRSYKEGGYEKEVDRFMSLWSQESINQKRARADTGGDISPRPKRLKGIWDKGKLHETLQDALEEIKFHKAQLTDGLAFIDKASLATGVTSDDLSSAMAEFRPHIEDLSRIEDDDALAMAYELVFKVKDLSTGEEPDGYGDRPSDELADAHIVQLIKQRRERGLIWAWERDLASLDDEAKDMDNYGIEPWFPQSRKALQELIKEVVTE
ncbi:hypothetical protein B0H63DRAFT_536180 [Podospora didyma]|uniref:Peptidase A1 domain-containing protein n=1 Tax=Podospora didyma TaxID=330526 RepID=A0AAE0K0X3_9PEZI|nr:hypothetical protein B0H63DRAFT_536180 [Podospora didyma]